MTEIFYNGQKVLANQPTPLVSREDSMIRYGERWTDASTITLRGQITGCLGNFSGLIQAQKDLINIFGKDFQPLEIREDNNVIHYKPYCLIKDGVKFPSSTYTAILEYEVSLECYEQNLFSGYYGVLDPDDTWEFQENDDRTIRISHSISAKGFNTSSGASNAFENARDFVQSRTGLSGVAYPYFISLPSGFGACLRTVKTNPNRFNGTYSVDLEYEGDTYFNNGGILRYTTEAECDKLNNVISVSIDGSILGCATASILDVRSIFNNFDIIEAVQESFSGISSVGSLNPYYLSSGVNEEPLTPKLSFNATFDNYTGSNIIFDYSTSVNSGENDVISVSVNGNIRARGPIANKWALISGYYNSLDLFYYADAAYDQFTSGQLNPFPSSSGVTFNQFSPEISVNATWDDRVPPISGFSELSYTFDFTPSLQRVIAKPLATNLTGSICGSEYSVRDLNYKSRCSFVMEGNGIIACNSNFTQSISNLKTLANSGFSGYCPNVRAVLEQNSITTGSNGSLSFSFGWSSESENNVILPRINYQDINQLSIK